MKRDGSFKLTDVPDGDYALLLSLEDQTGWYVKSAHLGPDDILTDGLHVERGTSGGTIVILVSSSGAQLDGSVTEDDKPVVGAHVRISPDPQTQYNGIRQQLTTTDQNGHFVISGISPGSYRVIARSTTSGEGKPLRSDPQSVTLSKRDHKSIQLLIAPPQND